VTTRGVFHRQGPFVGSGGLYSPGPATASPLLAMRRPLNDVLTPSWVSAGPSPLLKPREGRLSSFLSLNASTDARAPMTTPR
jgi:hypothetical protein